MWFPFQAYHWSIVHIGIAAHAHAFMYLNWAITIWNVFTRSKINHTNRGSFLFDKHTYNYERRFEFIAVPCNRLAHLMRTNGLLFMMLSKGNVLIIRDRSIYLYAWRLDSKCFTLRLAHSPDTIINTNAENSCNLYFKIRWWQWICQQVNGNMELIQYMQAPTLCQLNGIKSVVGESHTIRAYGNGN